MDLLKAIHFVNSVCTIFSLWKKDQLSVYENKICVQHFLHTEWTLDDEIVLLKYFVCILVHTYLVFWYQMQLEKSFDLIVNFGGVMKLIYFWPFFPASFP